VLGNDNESEDNKAMSHFKITDEKSSNQSPPLVDFNLFTSDEVLREALLREGGAWAEAEAKSFGELMGSRKLIDWGFKANEYPPILRSHDSTGQRIDEVEFHPAYHELMRSSIAHGLHSSPWRETREGAHVARAVLMMLASQNEFGHLCPVSMTYSAVPTLRMQPELAAEWEPRICSTTYDPRFRPANEKSGVLVGMAMTERQGGSDVRANTTTASALRGKGSGAEYSITGHKWFCSAPMSDAFLVLAQTPKGLSCFLLPRWTPEGKRNAFFIQRLKNKLGNRANASSEVEFEGAWARMVGEEGRGVATIIEMVNHTRLDCVIGSAALMRRAVVQATHHCLHRRAFGKLLSDQPLMQNVLADLCVESEAATLLMMRLARAFDRQGDRDFEGLFRRIATAIAKYWVCKRAPLHVAEALECLGGNGYVEESILPRLYREAPLNSIWEGSGNVICLDVLRAMKKEPKSVEALLEEINLGKGRDPRFDAFLKEIMKDLQKLDNSEAQARRLVERLALALQCSLLLRHGHPPVAEAFCVSRIAAEGGKVFGTLPPGIDFKEILERARPKLA
jgi:putative acyl-CoA dehydrogenase